MKTIGQKAAVKIARLVDNNNPKVFESRVEQFSAIIDSISPWIETVIISLTHQKGIRK